MRRYLQSDIEPVIYGGGQQQGLRSGTMPVALCVGMASAAELTLGKGRKREAKARRLYATNLFATCRTVVRTVHRQWTGWSLAAPGQRQFAL